MKRAASSGCVYKTINFLSTSLVNEIGDSFRRKGHERVSGFSSESSRAWPEPPVGNIAEGSSSKRCSLV